MLNKLPELQVFDRYYTDSDVEVTQRIRERKTELFTGEDSKQEADALARKQRSYTYPVFKFTKNRHRIPAGFAVPK